MHNVKRDNNAHIAMTVMLYRHYAANPIETKAKI